MEFVLIEVQCKYRLRWSSFLRPFAIGWIWKCYFSTTGYQVSATHKAVDAILKCSTSMDKLLNHQKMKKEYLRSYLIKGNDEKALPEFILFFHKDKNSSPNIASATRPSYY